VKCEAKAEVEPTTNSVMFGRWLEKKNKIKKNTQPNRNQIITKCQLEF